jgi:small ligand-binding sensory domain FIST
LLNGIHEEGTGVKCISALSTAAQTNRAFEEIQQALEAGWNGEQADLTVLFSSMHHADELGAVARALIERGQTRHLLGCTGESIVGGDREIERGPALSAWSAQLPGVKVESVRLDVTENEQLPWSERIENTEQSTLLFLGDPFSYRIEEFLGHVDERAPGLRVLGGMASGSQVPRGNQLLLDDRAFMDGAVALLLSGPVSVRSVVSQGCRPIGRTMIVTKAENNVIQELGRRPALEMLREIYRELGPDDQQRVQEGLHIGRVINEYQDKFDRGDFLVRNVMGADDSGAIQITDLIRVGQTVQFHVRDAETADEDLRENLLRAREQARRTAWPIGALLFTCNGRGTRLFGEPNHDVGVIHEIFGPIPVAGFFAMGEMGPIGGRNFMHGFTASVLLLERPE